MNSKSARDHSFEGHVDLFSHDKISGWAFDRSNPNEVIEVIIWVSGREIGRISADKARPDLKQFGGYGEGLHGFTFSFPQTLSVFYEWQITVCFADNGALLRNGKNTLAAKPVADSESYFDSNIQNALAPILVSSIGRSGSTLLMKLLLDHTNITGGYMYPYEVRTAAYFANAFKILSASAESVPISIRDTFDADASQMGINPFHHKDYGKVFSDSNDLQYFFSKHASKNLRLPFVKIINDFYCKASNESGRADPRYFAEKSDISRQTRRNMRLLYENVKEIILVRDLRDAVVSYRLFFKNQSETNVINHIAGMGDVLCRAKKQAKEDCLFVRYEDLVLERDNELKRIADFLEIPDRWKFDIDVEQTMQGHHGTSRSAESSIDRWKNELTEKEQAICNQKYAEYLELFRYK